MTAEDLASRLRQSVQGCSLHNHGPVQAWQAIEEAVAEGMVELSDIASSVTRACEDRIALLRREGVSSQDPRMLKEKLTLSFVKKLLRP